MLSISHIELEHGKYLKKISPYTCKFDFNYPKPPYDQRVLTALSIFDQDLYQEVKGWHRDHGGTAEVAKALSRYNRPSGIPMSKWAERDRDFYFEATQDTREIFKLIPEKAQVGLIHWYKPTASSSGLPHLLPKNQIHDQIVEEAQALAYYIGSTPQRSFKSYKVPPVIPFVKANPTPVDKFSTRGVWGYPAVITYIESIFGAPLYALLNKYKDSCDLPLLTGAGTFAKARAFVQGATEEEWMCSLDFVKGDTQPLADKLRNAFSVLEDLIDFKYMAGHLVPPHIEARNRRLWNFVVWYFINTPIVFNDVLYRKTSGFPSGSLFTMLLWLVFNMIEKGYLVHKTLQRKYTRSQTRVGGDDALIKGTDEVDLQTFLDDAKDIGTIYHPAGKSMMMEPGQTKYTKVLSTTFEEVLSIHRDEIDLFARMCYPPGWVKTTEESVGRVLTIALSVCKSMPRVNEFAEFYLDNAPVRLDRPIKIETNYLKYFKYVLSVDMRRFGATLRSLVTSFLDDITWTFLMMRI
jgi:hypothetical protein